MLIACSNSTAPAPAPIAARGPEFYPGAVYRINVDTDGDAHADVAFTFTFSEYQGGAQTGTAWYATGEAARQPGRKLIDDVYSYRFAWMTYGKVPPQSLKPHADLLTDFPYLGPPNP